jgi:UDP-glucose 4-epimerase
MRRDPKMTRHLLVGGNGFIGLHVAGQLQSLGHEVTVAGRSGRAPDGFRYRECELASADWAALIADQDVIHHYAWGTVPKTSDDDPVADLDVHVRSSLKLLEAAKAAGGKRILFASSGGTVYGHLERVPVSEADTPRPIGVYGAAKLAVETYMRVYHRQGTIDCRVARLANPYGVVAATRSEQGLLSIFARKALFDEPLVIWGDGETVRDYIHISDAADALCRVALAELDDRPEMPIFNIGSGVGLSINEIVLMLERQLNKRLSPTRGEARSFDVPISVLDIRRAQAELGWSPRITAEAGIALLLAELSQRHQAHL